MAGVDGREGRPGRPGPGPSPWEAEAEEQDEKKTPAGLQGTRVAGRPAAAGSSADAEPEAGQGFEGFMENGDKIAVRPRADRTPLLSLQLKGKQVCQLPLSWVNDDLAAGYQIMNELALQFQQKKVGHQDLLAKRVELLRAAGFQEDVNRAKKRPAAAEPPQDPPAPQAPAPSPKAKLARRASSPAAASSSWMGSSWDEELDNFG